MKIEKTLPIFGFILLAMLLVLPLGYSMTGTVALLSYPSSVISGQPFGSFVTVQATITANNNECASSGCVLELDPWTYNGQAINYIDFNGNLHYPFTTQATISLNDAHNSACDGNSYYASLKSNLLSGNNYILNLAPTSPIQSGTWQYRANIFSGCGPSSTLLNSGVITVQVNPSSSTTASTTTTSTTTTTTTVPSNPINFKFTQLKKYDLSFLQKVQLPFYTKTTTDGGTYLISIKNTGAQRAAPLIESYYISKENPFYANKKYLAESFSLQSIFGTGIQLKDLETCKKERGAVYTLSTLEPSQEGTFVIFVPYPRSDSYKRSLGIGSGDDMLAGNSNYNKDDQYVLVNSIINNCDNPTIFDETGGSVNFKLTTSSATGTSSGAVSGNIGIDEGISKITNNTPVNMNVRQTTTTRDLVKTSTGTALLDSVCTKPENCYDGVSCVSIQSLIDDGTITKEAATSKLTRYRVAIDAVGTTAGAGVGVVAGTYSLGTVGGVLIEPICAAIGIGTATFGGVGFPICLGVVSVTGAIVGFVASDYVADINVADIFHAIGNQDLSKAGYCIKQDDASSNSFKDFVTSIGKSINGSFGGKAKTGLDDINVGYTFIGILGLIILFILFKK